MKLTKRFCGTTASQIIITAESDLEANAIENVLERTYHVRGGFISSIKDGQKEFVIYPRAAGRQLRELELCGLEELQEIVKVVLVDPIMKLKRGDKVIKYMSLETQI